MSKLHQNSGAHSCMWQAGRLVLFYNRAEDPALPWWRRTWANDGPGGVRQHHLLGLQKTERDGQNAYFVFIGPFQLAFAWLQ